MTDELRKQIAELKELIKENQAQNTEWPETLRELNNGLKGVPFTGEMEFQISPDLGLCWRMNSDLMYFNPSAGLENQTERPVTELPIPQQKMVCEYLPKFVAVLTEKIREQMQ